jgi:hypothetical protein
MKPDKGAMLSSTSYMLQFELFGSHYMVKDNVHALLQ